MECLTIKRILVIEISNKMYFFFTLNYFKSFEINEKDLELNTFLSILI